jgi:hypothetical protein
MKEIRKEGGGKSGQIGKKGEREEDEKRKEEEWRISGKEVEVKMAKEERKGKERKIRREKEKNGGKQKSRWR